MTELRGWQAEALEKFLRKAGDFLCVATPGAGKTRFALAAAQRLIELGTITNVIVVAPTAVMRRQWRRAAGEVGLQLDAEFSNATAVLARDFDGVAVTYQSVAAQPQLYRRLATQAPTLVILDEVHHGGDRKSWGEALRVAFTSARRRLLLSGTPDRTDAKAVPFVSYDDDRKFVADYTYDYSDALADRQGVVRVISFPTFDGDARWLDALQMENKLRLSQTNVVSRAAALRSALKPDGKWIRSVLVAANDELSRQREVVPDAGGLVIASDQDHAVRYAALLEQITGEKPALAVSDVPGAADTIADFARGDSRWIVAVAMVSEGVDIPRLVVGVYATNRATNLFFRQVAGRFVRTRSPEDDSCASLFIPSVQPLVSLAADIERTIPRALKEAEERAERDGQVSRRRGEPLDPDAPVVVPLDPSEAVHIGTILSGQAFPELELRRAGEIAQLAGMPASISPAQMAMALRIAARQAAPAEPTVTVTIPEPSQPTSARAEVGLSLQEQKTLVRKELSRRVGFLVRQTNRKYAFINAELNRQFGSIDGATLDVLQRRLAQVERWIKELK